MMMPDSNVESVVYENRDIDGYDDVTVRYAKDRPANDLLNGEKIHADYYQVKFHMRPNRDITADALMDASFLGIKIATILSRLYKAWRDNFGNQKNYRLYFCTVRHVRSDDLLAKAHSNISGGLELDKIFDGRPTSKMAQLRRKMKSHIKKFDGVDLSDDDLRAILKPLRIVTAPVYEQQLQMTNGTLGALGYKPIHSDIRLNPYNDLLKNCYISGITQFNKDLLHRELEQNGLYAPSRTILSICLKSHPIAFSDGKHHSTLDLCEYFEGRTLNNKYSWDQDIYPLLCSFVDNLNVESEFELYLSTHLSIAYCLGQLIGTKKGYHIIPVQNTINGPVRWGASSGNPEYPHIVTASEILDDSKEAIALAIGIVNDISEDVKGYIGESRLPVKRLISCCVDGELGSTAIRDGRHALGAANEISAIIRGLTPKEKRATLHIFPAAPVSLIYELGRVSDMFGKSTIYEYDNVACTYMASFSLPV